MRRGVVLLLAVAVILAVWMLAGDKERQGAPSKAPLPIRATGSLVRGGETVPQPIKTQPFSEPVAKVSTESQPKERVSPLQRSVDALLPGDLEFSAPGAGKAALFGVWTLRGAKPAAHLDIRATRIALDGSFEARILVSTGDDGSYRFDLKPGSYEVMFGPARYRVDLEPGELRKLDHSQPPQASLSVRVMGEGITLQNARVVLQSVDRGGGKTLAEARTNGEGLAWMEDVPPGNATVTATMYAKNGGEWVSVAKAVDVMHAGVTEVVIEAPDGALEVTVVGSPDHLPVSGARVELRAQAGRRPRFTDSHGKARFGGVAPGNVRLRVSEPSHAPVFRQVRVSPGVTKESVVLPEGRTLAVVARDDAGMPMHVILKADLTGSAEDRPLWEVRTDALGRGEFRGLPPEEQSIEVKVDTCEPLQVTLPEAGRRGEAPFELIFRRLPKAR